MTPRRGRGTRFATIVAAAIGLALGVPARLPAAPTDGLLGRIEATLRPHCITPAATAVVSELANSGALQGAVGGRFAVARVDAGSDHVDLSIQDLGDRREHGVSLALTGARSGTPDGAGAHFAYFLSDPPEHRNPAAAQALLAVAALLDRSIPDTAIVECSGDSHDSHTGPDGERDETSAEDLQRGERRYPLSIALASAVLEVLVLIGALVFGLRAIPPAEP